MDPKKKADIKNRKNEGPVCVTGATGFLAGHLIKLLLKNGYKVRATVRGKKSVPVLDAYAKKHADDGCELQWVDGDLLVPGSFDNAVKGCWAVIHTANPVSEVSKNPQRDIVAPSVDGALNVLGACLKSSDTIKKFVLTSSIATIDRGEAKEGSKRGPYTEEDNQEHCTLTYGPYNYAKRLQEKAVVDFIEKEWKKKNPDVKYSSIHPSFLFGPQLTPDITSSNQIVKMLITGEYPMIPPLNVATVDVRDVARAHLWVLESGVATGRYIVTKAACVWFSDIAEVLREKFPEYPVPTRAMPLWMLKAISLFDARASPWMLKEGTIEKVPFSGIKITKELGFKYKEDGRRQTLIDTVDSFVDLGLVKPGPSASLKYLKYGAIVLAVLVLFLIYKIIF